MKTSNSLFAIVVLVKCLYCKSYNVAFSKVSHPKFTPRGFCPQTLSKNILYENKHSQSKTQIFADRSDDKHSNEKPTGLLSPLLQMLKPKSSENMSTKELLAKMGLSALLSYGFVSNMSYCVTVSLAWFGFTKKTGMSPLAPGQWKGFLALYAGFYVFNNIIRPIRIGISVGVAKYFDAAISMVQRKISVSKPIAIGIVVFLANIVGTCSFMALGITLASMASGVPIFQK